ncbi:MAG: choice-of-anchor E domain-containing protein [Fluviibacter sp.]
MSIISSEQIHGPKKNNNLLWDGSGGSGPVFNTVTYTFDHAGQTTEITQSDNLPKFNPILGTLTGASITIGGVGVGTIHLVTGAFGSTRPIIAKWFSDLYFGSNLAALNTIVDNGGVAAVSLDCTTGPVMLDQNSTYDFNVGDTKSTTFDLAGILVPLTGVGNFTITVFSDSGLSVQGTPLVSASGNLVDKQQGSITYTYTTP